MSSLQVTPISNSTSITAAISIGVYDWQSTSNVYPSQNTTVSNYIVVNSNVYMADSPSQSATPNYFQISMTFNLSLPLNSLDPSEVVTLIINNGGGSGWPSNLPVDGQTYYMKASISQGGSTITSPIFPYTISYVGSSTDPSYKYFYFPVGNFFTISSPGTFYRLIIEGYYANNS